MANLNLSQFGENSSVSDADYTFVWDSANAISKRVSRNSWLNSGELTSSAPVTISQTWNAGSNVMTALKVVATDTASGGASNLLELWSGSTPAIKVRVDKLGAVFGSNFTASQNITANGIYIIASSTGYYSAYLNGLYADHSAIIANQGAYIGFAAVNNSASNGADVKLVRDAANTLALRNGAAAQTFNVYGTYTSASVYERLTLSAPSAANAIIGTNKGSGGGTARGLDLHTDGAARMTITTAGNVGIGTTAPGAPLHVQTTAISGRESLMKASVNDAGNDAFHIYNGTGSGSRFVPSFSGSVFSGNVGGLGLIGQTNTANDNGSGPIVAFQARITSSETDPNNGTFTDVGTRPLFAWYNNATTHMQMAANGNLGIGTTSPTSKLHVVGDAVLTGDLLGTNYTIGVPTILTQSNISITNNHSGVADSAIVITPKGTGGIIVGAKPDGATTGGNVRGLYAVDLQINRSSNTAISSGDYSVICGGQGNTSSAINSFVGGGQRNVANASFSTIAGGLFGVADRYALFVHSAGRFAGSGDAQSSKAVFRNKTTTNSAVELFLDGVSARYVVGSGKIISMLINITGTKSDGSAVAHYVRQYSIKNIGGTTSEVYAAVTVGTDNAAGTSIALSANDTNDALKIEVTGVASETWRWVASVDAVEVGHGT